MEFINDEGKFEDPCLEGGAASEMSRGDLHVKLNCVYLPGEREAEGVIGR